MGYIGNSNPSVTTLGGDLDVNGHQIKSSNNGNIEIIPNGSGTVTIDVLTFPVADGNPNEYLKTDGSGNLSFGTISLGSDSVTYDMLQDTSQSGVVLGRYSSGAGTVQELSMSTLRSTMGLEYFKTIAVSGQSDIVADSGLGDTLTLVAGSNITLTTDASTDSVTIAASGGGGGGSFTGGAVANDIILGSLSNTSNHSNAVDIETVAEYDTIIGVAVGHAKQAGYFRNAWIYNSSNAATEPKYDEKIAIAFRNASGGAGGGADQAGFDFYSGSIQTYFRQAGYNYEFLCGAGGSTSVNNMRVSIYNASGSGGSSSVGAGSMIEFGLYHPDAKYKFTNTWSYGNSYNYTFPRTAPSASGQVLVSDSNGDCSWQANSSDIRVKKNIEDNEMGLEFIEALRTVNFEFKSYNELHSTQPELTQYQPHTYEDLDEPPEEHKKGVQTGLVAQELEEVLTSQGCEHFKGLFDDRYKVKQIDKEEFIMPLIKAVQELSQKVRDLEERLAE